MIVSLWLEGEDVPELVQLALALLLRLDHLDDGFQRVSSGVFGAGHLLGVEIERVAVTHFYVDDPANHQSGRCVHKMDVVNHAASASACWGQGGSPVQWSLRG